MKHPVLIGGTWRESVSSATFRASDPRSAQPIPEDYPVSEWQDCELALNTAFAAFEALRELPNEQIANFLGMYADRIEARSAEICELASRETALPVQPRLASGELPRTTGQLRQAATAARNYSWRHATIDTASNIRSCLGPLGPVAVFGPNNFPLAFGSISGGDFAAAIAAGNPVIAKANSLHPGTTRLLAVEADQAAMECGLPKGMVQLIYRLGHDDGLRLARDPRLAAIGYTGSRAAGLKLKAEADSAGKPIYLELSSVNPVVILPGAIRQRADEIAGEFAGSCLMGTGQFCTSPGLVVVIRGDETNDFIHRTAERFQGAPIGTLLSNNGQASLADAVSTLTESGAEVICGGLEGGGEGFSYANTLLKVDGATFLKQPELMQTEAFGNASLLVVADNIKEVGEIVQVLEGNLTGCVYSHTLGEDDPYYDQIAPHLRQRVGRLLNDKMPTGVAVSAAMNHGGPFPATGHPGFTAVGIPAAIKRFAMLQCYDNVRPHRLPKILRDENPNNAWRCIDGDWTQSAVANAVEV